MHPGLVALATLVVLACGGRAGASPLLPSFAGAALQSNVDVEAIRWRYRHARGYFWSGRRANDRDRGVADSLAPRSNADIETAPWRRNRRDDGWSDRGRASTLRDETDASGGTLTRPATSGVEWPDRRRRRGWVDPPPAR